MSKYSVGDKFVIEIGEVLAGYKNNPETVNDGGITTVLHRIKGFNSLVFDKNGLDKLQKLNPEMKIEDIDDMLAEHDLRQKEYNRGLNDAWELAKRIFLDKCDYHNPLSDEDLSKIFQSRDLAYIVNTNTPQEALAKLEAYEKEQEEIKVGDVVRFKKYPSCEVLITAVSRGLNGVHLQTGELGRIGEVHSGICKDYIEKTGKHIDISGILAEIGKE